MSFATETRTRTEWLTEARREIRLARCLATDPVGFIKGAWLNARPFAHAIENARIYRTLARHPWMTFLDVYAMGLAS